METAGGVYVVRSEDGTGLVEAVLRGKLKREPRTGSRVVPGDLVRGFRSSGDQASGESRAGFVIEEVLPRRSELVRAGPGGRKPKVVVANLDRCVVVMSALEPDFRPELADRFLALAASCGIPAVLVLNKADLPGARDVVDREARLYESIGYTVIPTSARGREGTDELARVLSTGVSTVIGPSGVGKSSLLNVIAPGYTLRTQPVSRGRGRQTTVGARLLPLPIGGWVADTPGFSDVGLWGIELRSLEGAFPEIAALAPNCRFNGCSHLREPDCAVQDALEGGGIRESRYSSYRTLREEIEEREPRYD